MDVSTFQELLPLLTANRTELRNIRARKNVLCIDTSGDIDFYFRDAVSLKLMLDALSFLSTGVAKYVDANGKIATETLEPPFITWK